MRAAVIAVAVAGLAACARRETGVEPRFATRYVYLDREAHVNGVLTYQTLDEGATVLVGMPIGIEGVYAATCSYTNTASWTHDSTDPDKYPRHWAECDREDTDLAVTCDGPCEVHAPYVVPTAAGELHLRVALASREAKRRQTYERRLHAVAAEEFWLGCATDYHATSPDGPTRCTTWVNGISVQVRAAGKEFGAPIVANGQDVMGERGGSTLRLARFFGAPPGSPELPAPGLYHLELRYGPLVRQVEVELLAGAPPKPPASQPVSP